MKSIVFTTAGNWLNVLEERDYTLHEPASNEVQIQVLHRPINPSDQMFIQGVYRKKPVLPQIAGLEGAGVIVKCGENVDPDFTGCRVIFRAKGTWAEYINLPLENIRLVPGEIPLEVACQLSLNTLTAYALLEEAQLKEGDHLLLTAASSSVATQVIQLAKERRIKIIAVIRGNRHLQKLEALGADFIVNSDTTDLPGFLKQNKISGINASLDAVGGSLGSVLIQAAAPFSRIIIYGRYAPGIVSFTNADIIYRNATIMGFGIDAWIESKTKEQLDDIWENIYRAIMRKALIVSYNRIFPLNEFKKAIESYQAGEGRILLH